MIPSPQDLLQPTGPRASPKMDPSFLVSQGTTGALGSKEGKDGSDDPSLGGRSAVVPTPNTLGHGSVYAPDTEVETEANPCPNGPRSSSVHGQAVWTHWRPHEASSLPVDLTPPSRPLTGLPVSQDPLLRIPNVLGNDVFRTSGISWAWG